MRRDQERAPDGHKESIGLGSDPQLSCSHLDSLVNTCHMFEQQEQGDGGIEFGSDPIGTLVLQRPEEG